MMKLLARFLLTVLFSSMVHGSLAAQEARHALVIGNNAYLHARPLDNPANDAAAIAASLEAVGFDVTLRNDTDLKGLKGAVREFVQKLPKGAVALVFYAGHGVQVKGQNYLIPVDAEMAEEFEVPDETLSMDTLMRGLEQAGTALNILILDCCRDDPYSRSWRGTRSAAGTGGLVMPADMPQGMFIAFSTSPGRTAEDGDGKNSPYSLALAQEILKPGLDFEKVFKTVGAQVAKATAGQQEPWVNTKFYGSFVFNTAGADSATPPPGPAMPTAPTAMPASPGALTPPAPPTEMTPDRSGGEELEVMVMEVPPFTAKAPSDPESGSRSFPVLTQISAKGNDIIDQEKWLAENGIEPVFLKVPNAMMGTPGELPATVPARAGELIAVRAFRDEEAGYVIYGEDFSAGPVLTVWTPDFAALTAQIDLSNYRAAPKVLPGDENYVDQATRFATVHDGILYVSHAHNTYAKSSIGMNAYLSAIDLGSGQLLWRSAPLVANCGNFLVVGDGIISGYGFTDEKDYLYVIDRHTGKTVTRLPVKSGPETLALIGDVLHVRTYNTDFQFRVK
jgi:hypothetical protein